MTPRPGTFADLIARYRLSPRCMRWGPGTRRTADRILSAFADANGTAKVADLSRGNIIAMRDSMGATPAAANQWLKIIRGMLAYAVDIEMVKANVALRVPKLEGEHEEGFRVWREDEIAAYLAHHEIGTTPHLALTLMLYTAAARVDVVKLGPGNVAGGRIRYRRTKLRRKAPPIVDIPILPPLAEALAILPPRMTFLQTPAGTQRSDKSLTGSMQVWVRQAGLQAPDEWGRLLNCHGLRKAAGRRLAQAGATPHELMAWLGHTDVAQVMTYSRDYDRGQAADSAAEKMGAATPAGPSIFRIVRS